MKAQIRGLSDHRVVATFENVWGDVETREYFVGNAERGYVKLDDGRHYPQVCERLASTGSTLTWDIAEDGPLVNVIRREYRAMKRAQNR